MSDAWIITADGSAINSMYVTGFRITPQGDGRFAVTAHLDGPTDPQTVVVCPDRDTAQLAVAGLVDRIYREAERPLTVDATHKIGRDGG